MVPIFLIHYPNLALCQAHLLSKLHAGVSCHALDKWFWELCEYLLETGNLDILNQPNHIYNCNETSFPMAPHPMKVIASKGEPHIYQQGSSTKADYHPAHSKCSHALHFSTHKRGFLQDFPQCRVQAFTIRLDGPRSLL